MRRLFLMLLCLISLVTWASDTKPNSSADDWKNPLRTRVRVRDLVKVKLEGIHLEVKDNDIRKVKGIDTIPYYGIKVTRIVDKKGKELNGWRGAAVLYFDSKKGKDLIAKHKPGQELLVQGRLDVDLRILEVDKVELASVVKSNETEQENSTGN